MNISMILYVLSWVMKLEGISMILPLFLSVAYRETRSAAAFFGMMFLSFALGSVISWRKPKNTAFYAREGFVSVALSWVVLSVVGALPFYFSGRIPDYIDAVFEIVSGFTTTGSSILSDVEALGKGLLFWRSFSHWVGGMGVLVLILTILPLGGGYNMMIMKAESPGPDVSKIVPRVRDTAKALYTLYIILTLLCTAAYLLSGMSWFDAVCIAFGTAGTGGFSVRNSGMADYSILSQFLISVFMILFGINFNVYYLLSQKKWKKAGECEEARVYLSIILVSVIFCAWQLVTHLGERLLFSLHHSLFTVASIITTTGFSTLDFDQWSQPSRMLILFLMICGACAGSTGGGLKVSRLIIMLKESAKELHLIVHPKAVRPVRLERKAVEQSVLRSVNNYMVLYLLIFSISIFLISFDGFDYMTNFSAVAANFNNIGPGLSKVGPIHNYAEYSAFSKLVLIFDMLAGRLEILPMLTLFSFKTWKKSF